MKAWILFLFFILHTVIDATGDAFGYKAERPEKFKWSYHRIMDHVFQDIISLLTLLILVLCASNFSKYNYYFTFERSSADFLIIFIKGILVIGVCWSLVRDALFNPLYNIQIKQKANYIGKTNLMDIIKNWLPGIIIRIKIGKFRLGEYILTFIKLIFGNKYLQIIIYLLTSYLILNHFIV